MTEDSTQAAFHGHVTGRVQRVGFRYFTRRAAKQLGITGWVRNGPDGRVEFVAEGPNPALRDFLAKLLKGPPTSRVDDVNVRPIAPEPFDDFTIR